MVVTEKVTFKENWKETREARCRYLGEESSWHREQQGFEMGTYLTCSRNTKKLEWLEHEELKNKGGTTRKKVREVMRSSRSPRAFPEGTLAFTETGSHRTFPNREATSSDLSFIRITEAIARKYNKGGQRQFW